MTRDKRAAAQEMKARLEQAHITARAVELPKKDAAEFIASGGTADDVRQIYRPASDHADERAEARATS